jgi:chorismate mutase
MIVRYRDRANSWLAICLMSAVLVLLASCQSTIPVTPPEQAALKQLLILVDQRLAVAPLVAKAKWNSGAPIDDPAREKLILDAVSTQAMEAGIDVKFARELFQSQFDAGKLIQQKLHEQWRLAGQPHFADAPDLGRDVRPVLDRLSPQILATLHTVYPILHQAGVNEFIEAQGKQLIRGDVGGAVRNLALRPLLDPRQTR